MRRLILSFSQHGTSGRKVSLQVSEPICFSLRRPRKWEVNAKGYLYAAFYAPTSNSLRRLFAEHCLLGAIARLFRRRPVALLDGCIGFARLDHDADIFGQS